MDRDQPRWSILISRQAERILERLPQDVVQRVDRKIQSLTSDPRPPGCKKLRGTGYDNLYRVRAGNWRISYAVESDELVILVIEVAPRGQAYRF